MCPRITRARSRGPLKNSLLVQRDCTQRIPPEEKETCRGKGFEGEREGGKKRHYANARFRNARAEHGRDRLTRLSRISRIWRDWLIRAARTPSWYTRLWAKKIYRIARCSFPFRIEIYLYPFRFKDSRYFQTRSWRVILVEGRNCPIDKFVWNDASRCMPFRLERG